jgi:N-acetylmuramoyl-L-alanine amidase
MKKGEKMEIIKAHAVNNLCYKASRKMVPKGIVLHSTGANNPYLKRYVDSPEEVGENRYNNHWNNPTPEGKKVCVHAFIGYAKDKIVKVAEILPLDICCWGAGNGSKGSYNYDPPYIQIEICEDSLESEEYYKKAFALAEQYCAHLAKSLSIPTENIVGHNEAHDLGYASDHSDPEKWMRRFGDSMSAFRERVKALIAASEPESPDKKRYGVVVGEYPSEEKARVALKKARDDGFIDAFIAFILRNLPQDGKESVKADSTAELPKKAIALGSTVMIKEGARTYDGGKLASFVYERKCKVIELVRDRAVITSKGSIIAAMNIADLVLVE